MTGSQLIQLVRKAEGERTSPERGADGQARGKTRRHPTPTSLRASGKKVKSEKMPNQSCRSYHDRRNGKRARTKCLQQNGGPFAFFCIAFGGVPAAPRARVRNPAMAPVGGMLSWARAPACFNGTLPRVNSCLPLGWTNPHVTNATDTTSVLFLVTWYDLVARMDRFNYDLIEGFLDVLLRHNRSTLSSLDVFGPGMSGWNLSATAAENIDQRIACCPSLIFLTGATEDAATLKSVGSVLNARKLVPARCLGVTELLTQATDCNSDAVSCREQWSFRGMATIWATQHWHFALAAAWPPPRGVVLYNMPFCASSSPPHPEVALRQSQLSHSAASRSGILGIGVLRPYYPLRMKLKSLIAAGRLANSSWAPHPSQATRRMPPPTDRYLLSEHNVSFAQLTRDACGYDPNSVALDTHANTARRLVNAMGHARICAFDSGFQRKTIRKYAHSFALGCVPAADIPDDMPPVARRAVIRLEATWSDEQIIRTLTEAHADVARLDRMAALGRKLFESTYSCTARAEDMLDMLDARRDGRAGWAWTNSGFAVGCQAEYMHKRSVLMFPWCSGNSGG